MRKSLLACAGLLAISSMLATPAGSQTATNQFNVQITISEECLINSASDLVFPSTGVIDANVDAASAIAVQCTDGTAYDIGLNEGIGTGATVDERLMSGPNSETVTYSLYTDAARSDVWGDTIATDTVSATGTGDEQTYDVFGRVPPQTAPTPGIYNDNDTITVTVTY
ncbi:spore coat U domain-containing protein (plasmid) [Sinorhizobium meliloti]|nr:spore coat U domain-containing protein [Sinorhizobium meliloti]